MAKQHTKPCNQCPWRKKSAPGWLGASTPVEFLQQSEAEIHMPCHIHVDYEDPDWMEAQETAPQCAGRAIFFANRCKQAKSGRVMEAKPDDSVFSTPQEFINHHTRNGKPPKVMIIGAHVVISEDEEKSAAERRYERHFV